MEFPFLFLFYVDTDSAEVYRHCLSYLPPNKSLIIIQNENIDDYYKSKVEYIHLHQNFIIKKIANNFHNFLSLKYQESLFIGHHANRTNIYHIGFQCVTEFTTWSTNITKPKLALFHFINNFIFGKNE